jgi:O-antigen ligase
VALRFTYTLGGPAAAIGSVVGLAVLGRQPALRRWLGPALLVAAVGLAVVVVAGAAAADISGGAPPGKWAAREWIWGHALRLAGDHLWLGSGLGTYAQVSPAYFADPQRGIAFTLNAHNQHLTALAEGGLVGFAAWAVLWLGVGVALHRAWAMSLPPVAETWRRMATGYLLAFLPLSFVHDVLFHPVAALLVWLSVGVVLALGAAPAAGGSPD